MKPASDYKPLGKAILLGGPGKVGKTTLATMFPDAGVCDWDHNLSGAIAFNSWNRIYFSHPDTAADDTPLPLEKQWERHLEIIAEFLRDPKIKTIVDDSLTPMSAALMAYVLSESNAMEKPLRVGGIQVPTKSHYQPFAMHLQRFLTKVRQGSKLFIMTCHLDLDTDELTSAKQHMPLLVGKMKSALSTYFSDYWHCKLVVDADGKVTHYIEVKPTNNATLANTFGLPSPFVFTPQSFKPYWEKAMAAGKPAAVASPAMTTVVPPSNGPAEPKISTS